jgi:ubiquitin carboxyl-terminal hydrolase 34
MIPNKKCYFSFLIFTNLRYLLNPNRIMHQITCMRSLVIKYMCQLSDKDLRLAGTKNTTELMYNTFKDVYDSTKFKIDLDGLSLAYKYFMSSTLTIRLCGKAQMNNQINTWSEFNSSQNSIDSNKSENELADWFCENKIIEHLYGPNLHVEVIKRSQDILNFLAYTNRINDKHLDIIWQAAQLKHCSKPVLDMLIALHKHLYPEQLQYLNRLIFQMDLSLHNEQTLHLSACLTKFLWSTMIDIQNKPKDTLVFQPLVQSQDQILSSNDDPSDDELSLPNKITKRHNQSMDTQPQSDDDDDDDDDDEDNDDNSSQARAKSIPKKRRSNTRYIRSANEIDTEEEEEEEDVEEELYDALDISKEDNDRKKSRKRNISKEIDTEEEEDDEELVGLHDKLQEEIKTSTTEQSTNTSDEQSTSTSGSAIDETIVLSQHQQ